MPNDAAAEKARSAEHGDGATVRYHHDNSPVYVGAVTAWGEEPIRAIERSFAMMKSFTGSVARRAYLPSKYLRINSRLRSLRRILKQSPLRLLGITGDRECCAPACSREASCPNLNASRPSFHSLQLSVPPVRTARPT